MMGRRALAGGVASAALLFVGSAHSALLRVPADYPTIYQGLDVAGAGDSVLVAPGTYSAVSTRTISTSGGDITFTAAGYLRSGVTLLSETGAATTTIRVTATGSNVHCLVAVGLLTTPDPARVEGFTLLKTVAVGPALIVHSNPQSTQVTVTGCAFTSITGGTLGGGIYQTSGNLSVTGSTFTACTSVTMAGGIVHIAPMTTTRVDVVGCTFQACLGLNGGALETALAETHLSNCTFRSCTAPNGGAVYSTATTFHVDGGRFEDNRATSGSGGAVWWSTSSAVSTGWIRGSVFLRNLATNGNGGGIYWANAAGDVSACTFSGNRALAGSAVVMGGNSRPRSFLRNIVADCLAGSAASLTSAGLTESCNVYWNNPGGHTSLFTMSATSAVSDPQFCNATGGDYQVSASSLCAPGNFGSCGLIGALGVGCAATRPVTVAANQTGLVLMVDGVSRSSPYYPDSVTWAPGTQHTVQAITPQDVTGTPYLAWAFQSWTDGGDTTHVVTVPPHPAVFVARYAQENKASVTLRTSPASGLHLLADGVQVTSPAGFNWARGSSHFVEAISPQPADAGQQWAYASWSDGGTQAHSYYVASTGYITLQANYVRQPLDGVLVDSAPHGRSILVDGVTRTTPLFFPPSTWPLGSEHSVGAITPQEKTPPDQTVWAFTGWSDLGDTTHVFTVPAGHLDLVATYVSEDKVPVRVESVPPGRTVRLDGVRFTTPHLEFWPRGTAHTIAVPTPQAGEVGQEYRFVAWSDSGAASHAILVPAKAPIYTATFELVFLPGIVLRTLPSGLTIQADGTPQVTPAFLPWAEGEVHSLFAASPQSLAGLRYVFGAWDDSTTAPTRSFTQPAGQASVTAGFLFDAYADITIDTAPVALPFTADDIQYLAPQALVWATGSTHAVTADSLVQVAPDTRYRFRNWADAAPRVRTIVAPGVATTYQARYDAQYLLTTTGGPNGTVTPATGFFTSGATVPILATPRAAYFFQGWVGTGMGSYTGLENPRSLVMVGPISETATFVRAAFDFALSLSATEPDIQIGPPLGPVGSVYLWFVCGSGQGLTRFEGRVTGDLPMLGFAPRPGVLNAGAGSDLQLLLSDCRPAPFLLGTIFTTDVAGGEMCLGPTSANGWMIAQDCTTPVRLQFPWPDDMRVEGIATNGAPPCISGRACTGPPGPIAIQVSGFSATAVPGAVEVRWSTSLDARHDGFRVYRSQYADGGFRALNDEPLYGTGDFLWRDTTVLPRARYFYLLGVLEGGGEQRLGPIPVTTGAPLEFAFEAARPNPFVQRTEIPFVLAKPGHVTCSIYDVRGRLLGNIVDASYPAGAHTAVWEGGSVAGRRVAAGVYFLRLQAGALSSTRKVVMLEAR